MFENWKCKMSISLQRSVLMLRRTGPRNHCFAYRVRLPAVTCYTRKQRGKGRTKHAKRFQKDIKKVFVRFCISNISVVSGIDLKLQHKNGICPNLFAFDKIEISDSKNCRAGLEGGFDLGLLNRPSILSRWLSGLCVFSSCVAGLSRLLNSSWSRLVSRILSA